MFTRYGGLREIRGQKTGWFHVERINGKFWLVDPDGGAFFVVGINRVGYHGSLNAVGVDEYNENIRKRFPTEASWARHIAGRLRGWNFNTSIRALDGMCHTGWCAASQAFAVVKGALTAPGVPDYMTFVDIFDPAWIVNYRRVCAGIPASEKNDRRLIGYYTDNELFWGAGMYPGHSLFDAVLCQQPEVYSKRELVRWLKERYRGNVKRLACAWGIKIGSWQELLELRKLSNFNDDILSDKRGFLFHYARHYFKNVDEILKKADPHHLNLGCRIHGWIEPEVVRAMGEFVDVISFNKYDGIAPQYHMEEIMFKEGGRPTIISEWGFRGNDAGLTNTSGVGRITRNQDMRGKRYAGYLKGLAESPYCVGSVFFAYLDDPYSGGGGKTRTENSNYGLVNLKDEPYARCVRHVVRANAAAYHQKKSPEARRGGDVIIAAPKDYFREPVNSFFVQRTGRVLGGEHVRAFLRGRDAGIDSQEQIFRLDFPRPVKFGAFVYETEGRPVIEMALDGRTKAVFRLSAAKGLGEFSYRMPKRWHTVYNREYGVVVPAGRHTVTVRNKGNGFAWLDCYRIHIR